MTGHHRLGWIGMGRMGTPMAELLLKAGHDVQLWNRTKAKAEPLAAKGAKLVDRPSDLSTTDILFTMVSTGKDLEQVYFGEGGVATRGKNALPKIFVDCSSIGVEKIPPRFRRSSANLARNSWPCRCRAMANA